MAKVGDTVRFLSTTGGGRVVKIDGQIAHVEEDDGFVTPVLLKELVVVSVAGIFSAAQVRKSRSRKRNVKANSCLQPCLKPRNRRLLRKRPEVIR